MARAPKEASEDGASDQNQTSVAKALELLLVVGELGMAGNGRVRMPDLVGRTGLSRPTAHRLLNHLKEFGLIEQGMESASYGLGPRILTLGAQHLHGLDLRRVAQDPLRELVEETGHTAHLGIRVDREVVFIDKVESRHGIRIASAIGQRRDLTSTAIGKAFLTYYSEQTVRELVGETFAPKTKHTITSIDALLKELERTKTRGYSIDDEETEIGIRCVGAAIFDHSNDPVAAVSITTISSVVDKGALEQIGENLSQVALRISRKLGFDGLTFQHSRISTPA